MINFKRLRAKARYEVKTNKKRSWTNFVSTITRDTPITEVWGKIRRLSGKHSVEGIASLIEDQKIVFEDKEKAEVLAKIYSNNSSNESYDPAFRNEKTTAERIALNVLNDDDNPLNLRFTIQELEEAISSVKDGSPGPDGIQNAFLTHLPDSAKQKEKKFTIEYGRLKHIQGNG